MKCRRFTETQCVISTDFTLDEQSYGFPVAFYRVLSCADLSISNGCDAFLILRSNSAVYRHFVIESLRSMGVGNVSATIRYVGDLTGDDRLLYTLTSIKVSKSKLNEIGKLNKK